MNVTPTATESTNAPATDRCPRCGGGFHCGANDAAPCCCTTVHLTAERLAHLRERYDRCLCLSCLAALAAEDGVPGLIR